MSLLLAIAPSVAIAQTAEDTVMYMITGFEGQENSFTYGDFTTSVQQDASPKSAILRKTDAFGKVISMQGVSISRIDDCHYDTTLKLDDSNGRVHFVIDFSKAYDIAVHPHNGSNIVYVKGATQMCDNGQLCGNTGTSEMAWETVGNERRLTQAFFYFRTNYCRGGGF